MNTATPTPTEQTEHPLKFYTVFLNNRDMGSINTNNIQNSIDRLFPGAAYTVNETESTIDVQATVVQMLEIREHRIKAHVIKD